MQKLLNVLNNISTTSLRICVTLFVFLLTAISYLFAGKTISWNWLTFLSVMSGVDAAQFIGKRKTHIPDESSTASTDVQELSENIAG